MESRLRSFAKAISWRIIGAVTTFTIAWVFTRDLTSALSISLVETIGKTFLFYFHERLWVRIPLGLLPNAAPSGPAEAADSQAA